MKKVIIILISFLFLILGFTFIYMNGVFANETENRKIAKKNINYLNQQIEKDIRMHYHIYVKTNKNAKLYSYKNGKYVEKGNVAAGEELTLSDHAELTTIYFAISNSPYYIFYKDVTPISSKSSIEENYKNYVPFNESIKMKKIKLYRENNLVYDLNEPFEASILIKEENGYYVEYNQKLFFVKKEDVQSIISNNNSLEYADSISVLNYHFFYGNGMNCNEIICLKDNKFEEQIKYLYDHEYYTPTMKEFEWFLDGKIRFPKKTVLLTVDDGAMGTDTILPKILEKYNKRASLFLITGFNDKSKFTSSNVELHSHGNMLHVPGVCPGGQGGGIKCLSEEKVLEDLKITRNLLNGTTAFAYPFYEYNERAISLLKKAGFTLAFIGGNKKVTTGSNKMLIPRFSILGDITMDQFIQKIN